MILVDADVLIHMKAMNLLPGQIGDGSQSVQRLKLRGSRSKDDADQFSLRAQPSQRCRYGFRSSLPRSFSGRIDLYLHSAQARVFPFHG